MNPFGDGSRGALNVTSGITYLPLNTKLQYTTVNVGASGTIRPSGTTGSVLYICATESITINGTINVRDIVNYGNNTWGVTIDGQSFTSPGVANGGSGRGWANGAFGGSQSNGYGGGGAGDQVTVSGVRYMAGNGSSGSNPGGGGSTTSTRTSNGTSHNRNNGTGGGGGSGVSLANRFGAIVPGTLTATSGAGGSGNGSAGSASVSGNPTGGGGIAYGGGGGGGGGRAGRAGVHVVLVSPVVIINGTINTSGTNGINGGNGGRSRNQDGWRDSWGQPGGGGGGGNAGEIQVTYNTTFTDNGTYLQTGGSGGSGGVGGINNTNVGNSGTSGSLNSLTSTLIAPIVDFTANVTSGARPLTVTFTNKSSGGDTYLWDFGDGTTSTATNPTKTYTSVGTYTVSLTATNAAGSNSVTKTNIITTTIQVFERSLSGSIIFSGSATRTYYGSRIAGGVIRFSGGARAIVIRDAESLQDKTYLYKVYDPEGNYIETWKDVASEPMFTHEINTTGSTMTVELARNSDSVGTTTGNLLTEDDLQILTEDDRAIQLLEESRNQVGPGSSVYYNNRVDVLAYYGSVEPLYTEMDEEILTEDGEQILADVGAPNGLRIFTGFVSEVNSRYGNSETTIVQLTSFGYDLDQYAITTAANNDVTTVTFNSVDPSDIARYAVDQFVEKSNTEQVTYTHRENGSIVNTSTVVSYTFRANSYKDVLDKTLELMPSNWYYRVGLGDNIVYFRERSSTPKHLFVLGKHIKALDLKGAISNTINHTLFTGGGDPALYVQRKENPAPRTRRGLSIQSDARVTIQESAEIISDGLIGDSNKIQYRTTIEVLTKQYDIESINVGDTVGFRNFDNFVDGLTMQIIGLSYTPDVVQLQLETKPLTINSRIEDIRRNLAVTDNQNIPSTPV